MHYCLVVFFPFSQMYDGNVKNNKMKFGKNFFSSFKKDAGIFQLLKWRKFSTHLLTFTIKSDYLKSQTRVLIYFLIIRKFLSQLLHD